MTACAAIDNENIRAACLDAILSEFGYRGAGARPPDDIAAPSQRVEEAIDAARVPASPAPSPPEIVIEDAVIPTSDDRLPANPVVGADVAPPQLPAAATREPPPATAGAEQKPVRMIDLRATAASATGEAAATGEPADGPAIEPSAEPVATGGPAAPLPIPRPNGGGTAGAGEAAGASAQETAAVTPAPSQEGAAVVGNWELTSGPGEAAGRDLFLSASATGPVRDPGGRSIEPVLWIACRGARTSLFFNWDHQIRGTAADIGISVDGATEETMKLLLNVDKKSVGWWTDDEAKVRIRGLFGRSVLHAALVTPGGGKIRASFNIAGLQQQIEPVRQACGW